MLQWLKSVGIIEEYAASKLASSCFKLLQNPYAREPFYLLKKPVLGIKISMENPW
tara:strand:- start:160 stop:324 length:165 start_codon:yes stop_codon:yes gene_type:complete